jgi:gamma-glutamyl:cysteine ligase YbdK (ATP-grasp superfamily)
MTEPTTEALRTLGLFEGFGIELEYMIVDSTTLDVKPIADALIEAEHGSVESEIERGGFAWSNELARHVIELKTNGPAPALGGLAAGFAGELARIDALLEPLGARALPTAMHPWMDANREFVQWPHGYSEVYATFHRIFDCRGHGWANLQSQHVNLPFADDAEFGRLHAAVRALLPILPALSAASPFADGVHRGVLDTRLEVYRTNARRVPSVSGQVVPEPVFTRADYEALLESIYADLAPHDPEGLLRYEWVNARGCIARFDRMAIEIRVLDTQECPRADLAIAAAASGVVRALCEPARQDALRALATEPLAAILRSTSAAGEAAKLDDRDYLRALGLSAVPRSAGDVWAALIERDVLPDPAAAEHRPALDVLLGEGPLARRILRRTGTAPEREALRAVYRELADCLRANRLFRVEV